MNELIKLHIENIECVKCIHFPVCSRIMGGMNLDRCEDFTPTKYGTWIAHGNWFGHIEYECSACQGQTFDASEFEYCPHCGAKMSCED